MLHGIYWLPDQIAWKRSTESAKNGMIGSQTQITFGIPSSAILASRMIRGFKHSFTIHGVIDEEIFEQEHHLSRLGSPGFTEKEMPFSSFWIDFWKKRSFNELLKCFLLSDFFCFCNHIRTIVSRKKRDKGKKKAHHSPHQTKPHSF